MTVGTMAPSFLGLCDYPRLLMRKQIPLVKGSDAEGKIAF